MTSHVFVMSFITLTQVFYVQYQNKTQANVLNSSRYILTL